MAAIKVKSWIGKLLAGPDGLLEWHEVLSVVYTACFVFMVIYQGINGHEYTVWFIEAALLGSLGHSAIQYFKIKNELKTLEEDEPNNMGQGYLKCYPVFFWAV